MGNCTKCTKSSEYQDGPFLCWECNRGSVASPQGEGNLRTKSKGVCPATKSAENNTMQTSPNPWDCVSEAVLDKYRNKPDKICRACGIRLGLHAGMLSTGGTWRCPVDSSGRNGYKDDQWYAPPGGIDEEDLRS